MDLPGNSNTSNPDDSSVAQHAESCGASPDTKPADPTPTVCRVREGIMPNDGHRKTDYFSPLWKVKVTLLPSASWETRPEKGSNEHLRLKSRELIFTTFIQGRDSTSIKRHLSGKFVKALGDREWMPMQALKDTTTSEIHLSPLSHSDRLRDQDYDFLADTCLIQNEKDKLYLFVAPVSHHLTWDFIRHLPRVRPRSYKIEDEAFWDNGGKTLEGDSKQQWQPDTVSRTVIAIPFKGSPNSASVPEPTQPSSRSATSPTKTTKSKRGKYLCPYSTCTRSRVHFQYKEYLVEHIIGRHDPGYKGDAAPKATTLVPSATEKSEGSDLPKAGASGNGSYVDSLSSSSQPLRRSNDGTVSSRRPSGSACVLEDIPSESQEQLGKANNPELDSALSTFDKGKRPEDGNVTSDKSLAVVVVSLEGASALAASVIDLNNAEGLLIGQTGHSQTQTESSNESSTSNSIETFSRQLVFRARTGENSDTRSKDTNTQTLSITHGASSGKKGSHKRRRVEKTHDQHHNSDENGSDDDEPSSNPNGQNVQDNLPGMFACPFFKWNPKKYRCCEKRRWTKVHRVKEHLFRAHMLPPHECPRCRARFKERSDLESHATAPDSCSVSLKPENPEGVTAELKEQLRARKKKLDDCERWTNIYKILFPMEKDVIPSPWYEHPQLLNVHEYLEFTMSPKCQQDAKRSLTERIAALIAKMNLSDPGNLVDGLMKITQSHQVELFNQYLSTLPGQSLILGKTPKEDIFQQHSGERIQSCSPKFATPAIAGDIEHTKPPGPDAPVSTPRTASGNERQVVLGNSDEPPRSLVFDFDNEEIDLDNFDWNYLLSSSFDTCSGVAIDPNSSTHLPPA